MQYNCKSLHLKNGNEKRAIYTQVTGLPAKLSTSSVTFISLFNAQVQNSLLLKWITMKVRGEGDAFNMNALKNTSKSAFVVKSAFFAC